MCNTAYHQQHGNFHPKHQMRKMWKQKMAAAFGVPPVNVKELDDKYEIQLFAAGYTKGDFKLAISDSTLSVSVEKTASESTENWRRQEFRPMNFERHFELNEKIDQAKIGATYKNGVLHITLPKREGMETTSQEIKVS